MLIAAPCAAQIGNPAGMTSGTPVSEPGTPAPHYPNAQDRLFVHLAATGGMAEVQAAKLAAAKSQNSGVSRFARMMADEHSKANERLTGLARKANVPVPAELDPDHKAALAELDQLSGAQFDRAYMQAQLVDHQKTVQILQWELSNGQDSQLQQLAAEMLPSVLHHLQMVQAIMADLTGAGPQGLALYDRPERPGTK
jgi:putative membrane protein